MSGDNLVLLCNVHHQLVDDQPATWTVERLHAIKDAHEQWVVDRLPGTEEARDRLEVTDVLFSTALEVTHAPPFVYSSAIPMGVSEPDVRGRLRPTGREDVAAYIVREDRLLTFTDLRQPRNAFEPLVHGAEVQRHDAFGWSSDPDRARWYVDLLNRALGRHCARLRLSFDRAHRRFYFAASPDVIRRDVKYRPMNRSYARREVVWQPTRRDTGEARNYWLHRAVSLRFAMVSEGHWILTIRPGLAVTEDGSTPPASETIGRRVTRRMNRMYNYELLGEVHFWRDILGGGNPRFVIGFGAAPGPQHVQVSTELLSAEIRWPGIPEAYQRPFANVSYNEGLFAGAS